MTKVYNLNFLEKISAFLRKQRLKIYKGKKIKESKTKETRMYYIKFYIHIDDQYNPQVSEIQYEMVVPARAAFFAKKNVEKAIKRKVSIQVVELESMSDDEYDKFVESENKYVKSLNK